MQPLSKIYVALDTADLNTAKNLSQNLCTVNQMRGNRFGIKLGLEFFGHFGRQGISELQNMFPDLSVFLDLKYHDIPNTVAGAIQAALPLKPDFLNVHAFGGSDMMRRAADICHGSNTKILAVTILTSSSDDMLKNIGISISVSDQVRHLANLAAESGMDGVVCSAHEIEILRKDLGKDFILMVPGIRPHGSQLNDQSRVMTPKEALNKGASHLVIGRPITESVDPIKAAMDVLVDL